MFNIKLEENSYEMSFKALPPPSGADRVKDIKIYKE